MTNYEKIKNMSVYELAKFILAKFINDGISSDPCDYCIYDETFCNGDTCVGRNVVDVIAEWLRIEEQE